LAAKNIEKAYHNLKSAALEHVFSERLQDALVIPGSFDWVDVGSFEDLHDISTQDQDGNHLCGPAELEGVTNSYIRNDTEQPVAVIGVDNIVVVNTPNGILVTNKNFAQKVGDVSKKFST
jgi:mannose-1-phosphate guanylyltransferase